MMLIRISALYGNKKFIARSLGALLLIETGVNIWLISGAGRMSFPYATPGDDLLTFRMQRSHMTQIQISIVWSSIRPIHFQYSMYIRVSLFYGIQSGYVCYFLAFII